MMRCIAACILFALVSGAVSAQGGSPVSGPVSLPQAAGRPVARVNGAVLRDRDLLREMYAIFPYARIHNGFPKAMEADIRKGAMQMIVFEELVYQEAERRKIALPPTQLDRAFADFRNRFATGQEYEQFLKEELNGSQQLLRAKIRRSLLIEEMLKREVTQKAAVSVAEAKAYYDHNPNEFRIQESFAFQTISVLPPDKASAEQLKEAAKRAASALQQAKATHSYEEFGVLAEKISEDDYRVMMGDRKVVERSKLPPEIAQALLAMQPGQVSGAIRLGQAYCIARLNQHISTGMQSFEQVKDSLRKQLEKKKTEQLRSALDKKLRAGAKVEEL